MTAPAVAVLGSGAWGVTLAWLIARSGNRVALWTSSPEKRALLAESRSAPTTPPLTLPDEVEIVESLSEALAAGLVFLAVQPAGVRELMRKAAPDLRPEQRVIHVVKGLEAGGKTISSVIEEETLVILTGALAGPVVPTELWAGEDAAAVVGSRYQAVIDEATTLMAGPRVRVYGTRDIAGVEVGGAMRTPLAIAAGMLVGMGIGRTMWSVLLTRGIAEGGRLAEALGGDRATLSGLSGIGDWLLTTGDSGDPLVKAGAAMAAGETFGHTEGASRVQTLVGLADALNVDMPITRAVGAILGGMPLGAALHDLMTRASRPEID